MRAVRIVAFVALLLCLALCEAARVAPPVKTTNATAGGATKVALPVPPRFMWGWGEGLRGYCGSFSFQSFGLIFGNYISAQAIRDSADGVELLIGVNEEIAANNLRFTFDLWQWSKEQVPQAAGFASWIADHIDNGGGVVAGMFEQKDGGDADYDHIMPVWGYMRDESKPVARLAPGEKRQTIRTDVLGLYYNDLYRKDSLYGDLKGGFVQSRRECSAPGGIQPLAAPYSFCLPETYDYGIAITGNRDDDSETYPSRLVMPSWTEPDWGEEDQRHQPIVSFKPTIVITGLTAGKNYTILRFDHPFNVPVASFARGAYSKRFDITATDSTMTLIEFDQFDSDATIFYRTIDGLPPA